MQRKHFTKFNTHSWQILKKTTNSDKLGIKGELFNLIEGLFKKPTAKDWMLSLYNWEQYKTVPSQPFCLTLCWKLCHKARKRNNRHTIGKQDIKLSLIAADMRIHLENQKGSITNKLSKVVGNNCISIY